jgi:hypothetical protein
LECKPDPRVGFDKGKDCCGLSPESARGLRFSKCPVETLHRDTPIDRIGHSNFQHSILSFGLRALYDTSPQIASRGNPELCEQSPDSSPSPQQMSRHLFPDTFGRERKGTPPQKDMEEQTQTPRSKCWPDHPRAPAERHRFSFRRLALTLSCPESYVCKLRPKRRVERPARDRAAYGRTRSGARPQSDLGGPGPVR